MIQQLFKTLLMYECKINTVTDTSENLLFSIQSLEIKLYKDVV